LRFCLFCGALILPVDQKEIAFTMIVYFRPAVRDGHLIFEPIQNFNGVLGNPDVFFEAELDATLLIDSVAEARA